MMKLIDLDYAVTVKPYPLWLRLCLFVFGLILLATLAFWQHALQTRLNAQQVLVNANAPLSASAKISPTMQETFNYAQKTQQNLSFPWLQMLSELESVKAQHPHIQLLSLRPNKTKLEVLVTGEAKTFDQITQFLTALKSSPAFSDAMLLKQHLVVENERQVVPTYTFSMQLSWRV